MKLRRINALRYCDDETGTYYVFLSETTQEQAEEQVEIHLCCYLNNGYSPSDWFGTERTLPRLRRLKPPPPEP